MARGFEDFAKSGSQQKSVEEGETYEVTIEDKGKEGDGVAKIDGLVTFVPNTDVGDEVKVRIKKVSRNVAFAEKID